MNVYTAWPRRTVQIIGRVAEDHGYRIPLEYKVEVDGDIRAQGGFGAWILGKGKCDVDLRGAKMLSLRVKNHPVYTEQKYPRKTKQGLFWGEAYIVTVDGIRIDLSDLELRYQNIDNGYAIGKDYQGGRVTIVGNEYPKAIPTSPIDHGKEGVISIDLSSLDAVRFVGLIGADAFPGDESQRRKTYAVRVKGRIVRYVTVVEPFESENMIVSVEAISENMVEVTLKDGRRQVVAVNNIEHDDVTVSIVEYEDGQIVRQEFAYGA
jgi:hypothetical protein